MAEPSIDIEKLVREVLAEMGLAPGGDAAAAERLSGECATGATGVSSASAGEARADKLPVAPSRARVARNEPGEGGPKGQRTAADSPALTPGPSPASGRGEDGELRIAARVVTLADLGDRIAGVRRLVVGPNAVVTPAVRDELTRRNIPLVCGEPEPAEPAGKVRLVTIATGTKFDPAGLLRSIEGEGMQTELKRLDCLIATVDAFVVELAKERTLGVLLTQHAAAAICLANRVRGVRAVWGFDAAGVARDAAAVGANLLVLDPAAVGAYQLKQLVLQFCRLGPQECPKVFRQRLG